MTSINMPAGAPPRDRLELTGLLALLGCVGVLQFSIVAAQACLALALVCWVASLVVHHQRIEAPHVLRAARRLRGPHLDLGGSLG